LYPIYPTGRNPKTKTYRMVTLSIPRIIIPRTKILIRPEENIFLQTVNLSISRDLLRCSNTLTETEFEILHRRLRTTWFCKRRVNTDFAEILQFFNKELSTNFRPGLEWLHCWLLDGSFKYRNVLVCRRRR